MARRFRTRRPKRRGGRRRPLRSRHTIRRRIYKPRSNVNAIRRVILSMETPKYLSAVVHNSTLFGTNYSSGAFTGQPQGTVFALTAQAAATPTLLKLGQYPTPYSSDSTSTHAGMRSDRIFMKSMHF